MHRAVMWRARVITHTSTHAYTHQKKSATEKCKQTQCKGSLTHTHTHTHTHTQRYSDTNTLTHSDTHTQTTLEEHPLVSPKWRFYAYAGSLARLIPIFMSWA